VFFAARYSELFVGVTIESCKLISLVRELVCVMIRSRSIEHRLLVID